MRPPVRPHNSIARSTAQSEHCELSTGHRISRYIAHQVAGRNTAYGCSMYATLRSGHTAWYTRATRETRWETSELLIGLRKPSLLSGIKRTQTNRDPRIELEPQSGKGPAGPAYTTTAPGGQHPAKTNKCSGKTRS